jgi:hypothetical protein
MNRSILLITLFTLFATVAFSATYDLQIVNGRMDNGQYAVDIEVKSDVLFEMGGNANFETVFNVTHSNRGASSGQVIANSIANIPTGYSLTFTENGVDGFEIRLKRTGGNFSISTTYSVVSTVYFNVGASSPSINATSLSFVSNSTIVTNSSNQTQTQGNLYGLNQASLPVEYSRIELIESKDELYIEWRTELEIDNQGFDILVSDNGMDFYSIGHVPGNGTTSIPQDYSFLLGNINHIKFQYIKLLQTDFNGEFEHSKTLSVNSKQNVASTADYNISSSENSISIQFANELEQNAKFYLYGLNGNLIATLNGQENSKQITFNTSDLKSGVYLIHSTAVNGAIKFNR